MFVVGWRMAIDSIWISGENTRKSKSTHRGIDTDT
jgi:hypothetical protein